MNIEKIIFLCEVLIAVTATLTAVILDFKSYKINNALSITVLISGVILIVIRLIIGYDVTDYMLGAGISFVITFGLFLVRGIGAGDAKLLSAIGCVIGYKLIIHVIIISLVAGTFIGAGGILIRYLFKRKQQMLQQNVYVDKYNIMLHIFHFSPAILMAELISFAFV